MTICLSELHIIAAILFAAGLFCAHEMNKDKPVSEKSLRYTAFFGVPAVALVAAAAIIVHWHDSIQNLLRTAI